VDIKIVGEITGIETIAIGRKIRELERLRKVHGPGRWRKKKGICRVRFPDGSIGSAEVHRYEAHGLGRKEMKLKRIITK
jgi:hypothetical protein